MGKSEIHWCDKTWNVTGGCSKISEGCKFCWAERLTATRFKDKSRYAGLTKEGHWTGKIKLFEDRLEQPLHWPKPCTIFVASQSDLFHEKVPFEYITRLHDRIDVCQQHTFLVLTKRIERAKEYYLDELGGRISENIHLGVSISNPDEMWKATELSRIPAAVRWISFEPLLADVGEIPLTSNREDDNDLEEFGQHIDGVVVGGESGPGARPMHPDWPRNIRDQCIATNVPFYFKQWGKWGIAEPIPNDQQKRFRIIGGSEPLSPNTIFKIFPEHANSTIPLTGWVKVGKKRAGCLLDGKEWKQLPERRYSDV